MRHKIIKIENKENGGIFKVSIQIPTAKGWIERVRFSVLADNKIDSYQMKYVECKNNNACFETVVELEERAMYKYYFSFEANGQFQYYKKQNTTGITSISNDEYWKLTVGFEVPKWARGATMYHIFVDRYRKGKNTIMQPMPKRTIHQQWDELPVIGPDANGDWNVDFYGGNLKGIEETLGYIKRLGVDIIYLSPIVRSQSNHRYDTADYENVDSYAGTNEMLNELCEKAHQKGMKIILDAVFNHTGNDSIYFNQFGTYETLGAYQSPKSPYYDFYERKNIFGHEDFQFWWGMTNLPECNGNSEHWQNYIYGEGGVIDKWFSLGIDGLRLDVADELTDNFIEGIARAVKRNKPDGFILGEVWKNPMRMNRGYISSGKGMHSVMNYLMVDALIRYYKYCDIWKLENIMKEILVEYPGGTIKTLMNFTSTHDISRAIEIFGCDAFSKNAEWAWNLQNDSLQWVKSHKMTSGEYKYGRKVYQSYIFTIAFLPGIFTIFYGDEVGLQGIGNLANRAPYPWQRKDKKLLKFFRYIGKIRKQEKFLKNAELKIIKIDHEQFVFERYSPNNKLLVITSRVDHCSNTNIPEEYKNAEVLCSIKGSNKDVLGPYGAIALKKVIHCLTLGKT